MMTTLRRRSRRLAMLYGGAESSLSSVSDGADDVPLREDQKTLKKKRRRKATTSSKKDEKDSATMVGASASLPRTRQRALETKHDGKLFVIGIDEAGRGPLAGPVVAAAAANVPSGIEGICDSKKLTKEEVREEVYERLVASPHIRYAVAIVDAPTIDEINILQATFLAMSMTAKGIRRDQTSATKSSDDGDGNKVRVETAASAQIKGCYVVCGANDEEGNPLSTVDNENEPMYALVDGNKVPPSMPCEAEAIVKGDSKEYLIAAASILAKVTRDRLMKEYARLYPEYELERHKGYPTAVHMAKVRALGATPIHRRTFAPLKHMEFDEDGKIIVSAGEKDRKE